MKLSSQKSFLAFNVLWSVFIGVIIVLEQVGLCKQGSLCKETVYLIEPLGFFLFVPVVILPLSIALYFLPSRVFIVWRIFAIIILPVTLILTHITTSNAGGGGFFSIDLSLYFFGAVYGLFYILSTVVIIVASLYKYKNNNLERTKEVGLLNYLTQRQFLYGTLLLIFISTLLNFYTPLNISCDFNGHCQSESFTQGYLGVILLIPFGLLPVAILLYVLSERIFNSWKKFAFWAVPITALFISLMSKGNGYINQDADTMSSFVIIYSLFCLASFITIAISAFRKG